MSNASANPRRGYPLFALFLVLTGCGVVAALVAPALRGVFSGTVGKRDVIISGVSSCALVTLLGAMVGLLHYHRARGMIWGIIVGGAIGIFVGPMVVAPREALGSMLGLSLGGTIVVLCMTAAYRLAGRSARQPPAK